jgi:DNA-binding FadR family transcriptional regulator
MPFDSPIATASLGMMCDAATLGRGDRASNGLAAQLMREVNDQHVGGVSCRLKSEEQIGERFGASIEIVRRALRMLEDMGLIECQQGRRGALLRSNPQDGAVVRIICASLIARGVLATDLGELVSFISVSVNALAAQRVRDGKLSSFALRSAYAEQPGLGIAEQMRFENFLTELAGNPILSMLLRAISLRYLFSDRCVHRGHLPDHIRAVITDCNWRILGAIVKGDVEAAKQWTRQKNELMGTPP